MPDERPYADRPAARPDPNRIKARDAEPAEPAEPADYASRVKAANGGVTPTDNGGCWAGCLGFIVVAAVLGFIVQIIGSIFG